MLAWAIAWKQMKKFPLRVALLDSRQQIIILSKKQRPASTFSLASGCSTSISSLFYKTFSQNDFPLISFFSCC
jgi:hypothetical protein